MISVEASSERLVQYMDYLLARNCHDLIILVWSTYTTFQRFYSCYICWLNPVIKGCTVVVVSHKYAPPSLFATLALVQNAGGLIRRMRHFLSQLHPPFRCHKAWPHSRGQARGREMLSTLAVGWQASCSVEGRGSRTLQQSSWRVHLWCRRSVFVVDTLTVDGRVAFK